MSRRIMRLVPGAALVVAPAAAPAQNASGKLTVPYTHFTLPNGLQVILHEDHSVPLVTVNVWYHAGSGREKPGRTGFAHMIVYGLPDDFFTTYVQKVQAVTAQDLARVAAKHIQPDRFAVVVVGDRQVVEAKVKALNLGPVTVLKVEDVVR